MVFGQNMNSSAPSTAPDATPPARISTRILVDRLVRQYVRPHFGRIAFAVFCMILVAGATAANAWLMQPVLDDVFLNRNREMLYLVPTAILVIALIKGSATYGQSVTMNHIGQRIISGVQLQMFAHLMRSDIAFFQSNATGNLISRFNNDANMLRAAVSTALTGIAKDSLTLAFLVALMFYQDWLLALISFFVFPAAVFPIVRIGRRMRKVSANTQTQMGELTTILDETFQGARHVRAYGMEDYEISRAGGVIENIFQLVQKAARVRSLTHPIMETLGGVAIAVVILYGGARVIDGTTTPGTFFSFITALLLAYQPMKSLANLNASLQEGLAAAQRIFALIDVEPKIQDRPYATDLENVKGGIRFDAVGFAYDEGRAALDGITIDIPPGRTVALVGPSGAGKSTILNLIPRFYDCDTGSIAIDGHDIRDVTLASLRANIALVAQDITLFDDTVRANIAYGRPDASDEDIRAAAKAADAHDFIETLVDGYDTHVGGRGLRLSGGQRQRIAIARAMLKNAPILLLDEATSALDSETERQVQAALDTLTRGRTTVVIAHRLSTVTAADIIYVMDGGRVVEQGTHRSLLEAGGAYARLYAVQFAEQAASDSGAPVAAATA
jgi:subfamily B ATP-binding cassette protein MsbA